MGDGTEAIVIDKSVAVYRHLEVSHILNDVQIIQTKIPKNNTHTLAYALIMCVIKLRRFSCIAAILSH